MNPSPEIRRVGFGRGLRWLLSGADLLSRGARLLVPVSGLLLLVMMIQIVPVIGPAILALISPLLTAGLMAAFHATVRSQSTGPSVLFAGWRNERTRFPLLFLGLWLSLGALLAIMALGMWIAPQVDPEALERALGDPQATVRLLIGLDLVGGLLIAGTIMGLVLGALYFAVPLVFFAERPVGHSLLQSLRALLVNWVAFLGLFVAMLALIAAVVLVMGLVSMVLGLALGPAGEFLVRMVGILAGLFIQVLLAGAQYVAFREVFTWSDTHGESPESGADAGRLEV